MPTVFRYELKIRKIAKRELQKQFDFLVENGEELYNNSLAWYFSTYKTLDGIEKGFSRLENFWEDMGLYRMIDKIGIEVKKVLQL